MNIFVAIPGAVWNWITAIGDTFADLWNDSPMFVVGVFLTIVIAVIVISKPVR